jgi:hypothetical protein
VLSGPLTYFDCTVESSYWLNTEAFFYALNTCAVQPLSPLDAGASKVFALLVRDQARFWAGFVYEA